MSPRIRPTALAAIVDRGRVLAFASRESDPGERFHRLFGGGIEFGERSEDAVVREVREELGAELLDVRLLGVIENIYDFDGRPFHQIAFIFAGAFADRTLYDRATIPAVEADGEAMTGFWRPLGEPGLAPLYPRGVEALILG